MSETMDHTAEPKLKRHAKGKRPSFYEVDGLDEAMSMIMVLASELSIMRDRLDTVETIAANKGIILADEIDGFEPEQENVAKRDDRRQALFERLYYVTLKKAQEEAGKETEQSYLDVLEQVAKP
ncbi:MAG: hypothetical protein ABJP48_13215 [Erythrobacter sp.]